MRSPRSPARRARRTLDHGRARRRRDVTSWKPAGQITNSSPRRRPSEPSAQSRPRTARSIEVPGAGNVPPDESGACSASLCACSRFGVGRRQPSSRSSARHGDPGASVTRAARLGSARRPGARTPAGEVTFVAGACGRARRPPRPRRADGPGKSETETFVLRTSDPLQAREASPGAQPRASLKRGPQGMRGPDRFRGDCQDLSLRETPHRRPPASARGPRPGEVVEQALEIGSARLRSSPRVEGGQAGSPCAG